MLDKISKLPRKTFQEHPTTPPNSFWSRRTTQRVLSILVKIVNFMNFIFIIFTQIERTRSPRSGGVRRCCCMLLKGFSMTFWDFVCRKVRDSLASEKLQAWAWPSDRRTRGYRDGVPGEHRINTPRPRQNHWIISGQRALIHIHDHDRLWCLARTSDCPCAGVYVLVRDPPEAGHWTTLRPENVAGPLSGIQTTHGPPGAGGSWAGKPNFLIFNFLCWDC